MELLEFKNKIFELLNVTKTSEIGNALLDVVLKPNFYIFDEYKKLCDGSKDWLQALWQYYEADRAEKKQDYTPKSLCKLVSALAGNCETVYDCCGGSGALTVQMLKDSKAKFVCVEELDEKVIPFLLFNLCLHNVNGYVLNGDVLTRKFLKIYKLSADDKYSKVDELPSNEQINLHCDVAISNPPYNIKWTESEYMMLGEMIKNGYSYELISEKISKSVKAIRGRVYNTYLTERLDKVRAIIGDGNFGDNAAPKQLKHKNLLSAEEKSEVKELMSRFIACLSADLDEIKKFNVYFQKDMCQNWDKYRGCKAKENGCDECISFVRLKPQFCKRCGKDFIEHGEHLYCQNCREARLKQAQRKYAILNQKGEL